MFDWSLFSEICLYVLPMVLVGTLFFIFFMSIVASRSSAGMQVVVIIYYLLAIGVVVHEAAHYLFCKLFGVQVKEVKLFQMLKEDTKESEHADASGYVKTEPVKSMTAALFIGFAPLLVNGLLVALIIYYSPLLIDTPYYWLMVYLGIALAMGANPSPQDLRAPLQAIRQAPGRFLVELNLYFIFGGLLYALGAIWNVDWWGIGAACLIFFIFLIFLCRVKTTRPSYHLGRV